MATGWGRRKRVEMQKYAVNTGTPATVTTIYAGLDTNTSVNDDASNVTAGSTEPSSTGSYARQAITTWNAIATPSPDAAAQASNDTVLTWTSSAAFSTGATTLKTMTLWTSATLSNVAESFFEGRAAIAVPQAVNAAGITLTCADGGLVMGLISA